MNWIFGLHNFVVIHQRILCSESGQIYKEHWYLNKNKLTGNELVIYKEWLISNNLADKNYNTWTDEEKVLWNLRWL